MSDRRNFLKTLGVATGSMAIGWSAGCAEPEEAEGVEAIPGNQLERIGIQLYSVRSDMEKDFKGTLARIAAIGYKEVEFAGYFGNSPAAVRDELNRLGLSAPAAHIGTPDALKKDWEKTIQDGKVMGHQYLIVAWIDPKERTTLDDYRRHADLMNSAGEIARKAGVKVGYHNHDFEFAPIEGKLPYDVLLERTDPSLVAMELDLFWITKGGQNPQTYFDRYPGRFVAVHVKDMDGSPQQKMVDVGRGKIDFARIFAQRDKAGIRHFFVEHDEPESPLGFAKASHDYLKQLKF